MTRSGWMTLVLMGMGSAVLGGWALRVPGYMDADYYYATARQLTLGNGLWEPFLWNYLDDPAGLPHPSHLYWMPLVSFLAATSMATFGEGFAQAQLPFLLLTALLPVLTACLALQLTGRPGDAWHAGLLAVFPGFFLPFFWTTDSFSLYAALGGILLILLASVVRSGGMSQWLAVGGLIGMAHLARADGVLWLLPALVAAVWRRTARDLALIVCGYALVMAPWLARNLMVAGTLLGPGATRALWLLEYDELFSYPASMLTPGRWWSAGWAAILRGRGQALGLALQSLVAVNGLVFLAPLMALGAWELRRHVAVRLAGVYLVGLMLLMVGAFPFVGVHGGFFHSSAALMPALWAMVPMGLERAVAWASRWRRWDSASALRVFSAASVALAAALTVGVTLQKLSGWEASARTYSRVAEVLGRLSAVPDAVAVNNPPGFFLASGLPAVVIPNGSPAVLRQVLNRYQADWVVLDRNRPAGLADLYRDPGSVRWLTLEAVVEAEDGSPVWILRYRGSGGGS